MCQLNEPFLHLIMKKTGIDIDRSPYEWIEISVIDPWQRLFEPLLEVHESHARRVAEWFHEINVQLWIKVQIAQLDEVNLHFSPISINASSSSSVSVMPGK